MKVLIIDDEPDIRTVAQMALEMMGGCEVSASDGGAKGISMAEAEPFDVILLDVMMPEMDGPEVLDCLKANEKTKDLPVIFLTAKVHSGVRESLMERGAKGVIAKPFNPTTLHEEIKVLLAN